MKVLSAIVFLLSCSGAFGSKFYSCFWITSPTIDCSIFKPDPTCGTNIVTYANKCEFSKAHCNDRKINLLHYDNCTKADGTVPPPVDGSEVVLDFMCTSLSHMDCPAGGEKVCGNDGRTYDNACYYEKAKCTHRDLHVVDCTV